MQDPSYIEIKSNMYQIVDCIGEGSYGKVYKAKQFPNNQIVAIKVQSKITDSEKKLVSEFLGKKFKNLVNIFDYEEKQNQIFIVMEYCRVSLYDLIQKNTLKPKDARYVMKEIINGIEELHKLGLAHRDIKPENILIFELEDQGKIQEIYKICDFGTSKEFDKLVTKQVGTPYYLAPEQIQNQNQELYSPSIDIWAFGSVMYELFTNTPLFNGFTVTQIYDKILNQNINEKIDNLQDLEFKYKSLLKQMLDRNPKNRIQIQQIKMLVNEVRSVSVEKKVQSTNNFSYFKQQKLDLKPPKQINQTFNIISTNLQQPFQQQPQNLIKQSNIQKQIPFPINQQELSNKPVNNQFQIYFKNQQHINELQKFQPVRIHERHSAPDIQVLQKKQK